GGGTALRWEVMNMPDESALALIPAMQFIGAEARSKVLPQLPATGVAASVAAAVERPAEQPIAPIAMAPSFRGVFVPQVSIPPLRPAITFAPPAAPSVAQPSGERSRVVTINERREQPPLARTS